MLQVAADAIAVGIPRSVFFNDANSEKSEFAHSDEDSFAGNGGGLSRCRGQTKLPNDALTWW